jgi:hypothetical protein
MVHPDKINGYSGTLANLAEEVGNLRYDALAEFLGLLSAKLDRDANLDEGRGRVRLAGLLRQAACPIGEAARAIQQAWRICEPHMGPIENEDAP